MYDSEGNIPELIKKAEEGRLMHVKPGHGNGAEKFIDMRVKVTGKVLPFDAKCLDPAGRQALKRATVNNADYIAVEGQAKAAWKSPEDRGRCIERQMILPNTHECVCGVMHATRLDCVLCFAEHIKQGQLPKVVAVYLHPSLTGHTDDLLMGIDGSRRIMAHLEANINEFDVVVVQATAT